MSEARDRVEAEARERWPRTASPAENRTWESRRIGFIAGRTVSAEQVEEAEEEIADALREQEHAATAWSGPRHWPSARETARAAFHAAGFIVE